MSTLVGPAGASFIAATVVISTFGCNAAGILGGSRVLFAMARDGVFLPSASRVHPRYRTPHMAIVRDHRLVDRAGAVGQLRAALHLRHVRVDTVQRGGRCRAVRPAAARSRATLRPYRTWGYPIVPLMFVIGSAAFVLNTLMERPVESLAGLGLLAIGLPVYWFSRK